MYNKGAGVATRISIPGKYLVLIPFNNNVCVSRKIKNKDVRDKLCEAIQNIVNEFGLNNFGIILRTSSLAFIDVDNEEDFKTKIKQDLLYLLNKWSECLNNLKDATVGTKILSGDSRIVEILKDQLLDGFDCIYVDDKDIYEKIKDAFGEEYLKKGSIKLHQNSEKSLFRISRLRHRSNRTNLDKTEAQFSKSVNRYGILVKSGSQTYRIFKMKPHDINWLMSHLLTEQKTERRTTKVMKHVHGSFMYKLRIKPENNRPYKRLIKMKQHDAPDTC